MNLYVTKNGQQMGPYTLPEAQQLVAAGTLLPNDWAWYEGITDWVPLEQVPGFGSPAGSGAVPVIAASEGAAFASATPLPPVRRPVLVWVICLFYFICIPLATLLIAASPTLLSYSAKIQEKAADNLDRSIDNTTDPAQKNSLIILQKQFRDNAARTVRIGVHGVGYYVFVAFSMLLNLTAAILLFLLRRPAFYAFAIAFGIGVVSSVYTYSTMNWSHLGAPGQSLGIAIGIVGAIIGWAINIAILYYVWRLFSRGVLR